HEFLGWLPEVEGEQIDDVLAGRRGGESDQENVVTPVCKQIIRLISGKRLIGPPIGFVRRAVLPARVKFEAALRVIKALAAGKIEIDRPAVPVGHGQQMIVLSRDDAHSSSRFVLGLAPSSNGQMR